MVRFEFNHLVMLVSKMKDLFPHDGFPYRLVDPSDKKKVCWFQCQEHLDKHITRYGIEKPIINVKEGFPAYVEPKQKKPRKKRTTKPKMSNVSDFHKPSTKKKKK